MILPTDILILASIILSFITLITVLVVFAKVNKAFLKEARSFDRDKRVSDELSGSVEDLGQKYADEIVGESAKKVELQITRFTEELARLLHAKSAELGAYVEKAQQEQVRESQYFVANMLTKIEKEAEEYRQNKLKKVDEQIREIVQSAAKEVIGRAISLSEHEDLVTKALEKAKKDRIFT